jgi:hypothetical protein
VQSIHDVIDVMIVQPLRLRTHASLSEPEPSGDFTAPNVVDGDVELDRSQTRTRAASETFDLSAITPRSRPNFRQVRHSSAKRKAENYMLKSSITISSPRTVETFGVRRAVVDGLQRNGRWSWTFRVEAKPNAEGVAPMLEVGPIEYHVDDVSGLVGASLTPGREDDDRGSIYVYDHLPLQNNLVFVERKRWQSLEVRWTATMPDPDRYDEGAEEHHVLVHAKFRVGKLEMLAGGSSILFLEPPGHPEVMAKFFRSRGHRAQTVFSIDEALASLANTSFDFVVTVFLDVPSLMGLCEALRARGHSCKLLVGHEAEDGELPVEITAQHVVLDEVSSDAIMAAMSRP